MVEKTLGWAGDLSPSLGSGLLHGFNQVAPICHLLSLSGCQISLVLSWAGTAARQCMAEGTGTLWDCFQTILPAGIIWAGPALGCWEAKPVLTQPGIGLERGIKTPAKLGSFDRTTRQCGHGPTEVEFCWENFLVQTRAGYVGRVWHGTAMGWGVSVAVEVSGQLVLAWPEGNEEQRAVGHGLACTTAPC